MLTLSLLACKDPASVDQQLVTTDSGTVYYRISFRQVTPAVADSVYCSSDALLCLPLFDPAKAGDANTHLDMAKPFKAAPRVRAEQIVAEGLPASSDNPYIRFRQALTEVNGGWDLYYPKDAVSVGQLADDLANFGVKTAYHFPACETGGNYLFGGAPFELLTAANPCSGQALVLRAKD